MRFAWSLLADWRYLQLLLSCDVYEIGSGTLVELLFVVKNSLGSQSVVPYTISAVVHFRYCLMVNET